MLCARCLVATLRTDGWPEEEREAVTIWQGEALCAHCIIAIVDLELASMGQRPQNAHA